MLRTTKIKLVIKYLIAVGKNNTIDRVSDKSEIGRAKS